MIMKNENNTADLEQTIQQELLLNGWEKLDVGSTKRKDYNKHLMLYKRTRNLRDVVNHSDLSNEGICEDILEMSSQAQNTNPEIPNNYLCKPPGNSKVHTDFETILTDEFVGSNPAMGIPTVGLDPDPTMQDIDFCTPKLSQFDNFPSLQALRSNDHSLVIGFDSEYYGDDARKMLCWQFALIDGAKLIEYVFIKRNIVDSPAKQDLWIELALPRILDDLNSPLYPRIRVDKAVQYEYIYDIDPETGSFDIRTTPDWDFAFTQAKYAFVHGKPTDIHIKSIEKDISSFSFDNSEWRRFKRVINNAEHSEIHITLVSHTAKVDISSLYQEGVYRKNLLRYLTEAGGGVFSMRPIYLDARSVYPSSGRNYLYPITLHVRDSLCSSPEGNRTLSALGKVVGVRKVDLPPGSINHMDAVLTENPALFMEYASRDAVIALLYTSAIYGVNKRQAVTILSAGTKLLKESMSSYLGVDNTTGYDRIARGLEVVKHGKIRNADRPGFIESRSLEPINCDAVSLHKDASEAYHGGYNSCSDVGYYSNETYDYDLQNAYPSAMSLVPDVNWENCILKRFEANHILTEQDFLDSKGTPNPIALMFGNVHFEFPENCQYPCLPNNIDGNLIFTRTLDSNKGIFACGPELYLAVKLGAKVTVKSGYTVRTTFLNNGELSYSMRHAVKQLIVDRRNAKKICGKGSLEEQILKLIVCGVYGKIAQNVIQKSHWSAYTGQMANIGCSSITNPVSAAMTTSIVRAVLLAAQNQITQMGYTVYSVTTDGLISDIPKDLLKSLDLYGLRDKLAEARLYLTDGADPEIWEIKHQQNDLLNLTTRGNVSLNTGSQPKDLPDYLTPETAGDYYQNPVYDLPGVCAHNGTKSGYISDSYDDRLWLIIESLSRTKAVVSYDKTWTSFKDLVAGMPFRVKKSTKHIRMDFDMKRRPVQESMLTVYPKINGVTYEIANFTTAPFDTPDEYLKYRDVKKHTSCLRTKEHWDAFFRKLLYFGTNAKPRDYEFAIIRSIIMLYRNGKISIPYLDNSKISVEKKCEWINRFNGSNKVFSRDNWKNARRADRLSSALPLNLLKPLIKKMQECSAKLIETLNDNSAFCYPPAIIDGFARLTKSITGLFEKMVFGK